jgi:hypothetical protein
VPTVTYQLLFVLVILAHDRRRIVHVAVTDHPTAAWTAQQLRNAFPEDQVPRYLLHDRDADFKDVVSTIGAMRIHEVVTAPRSPGQNAYVERLIGSIRRECLDHMIILSIAGLQRVLADYIEYYMNTRTHLSLGKDTRVTTHHATLRRRHRRDFAGQRAASPLRPRSGVATVPTGPVVAVLLRQQRGLPWRVQSGTPTAMLRIGVMPPVAHGPQRQPVIADESALSMPRSTSQ